MRSSEKEDTVTGLNRFGFGKEIILFTPIWLVLNKGFCPLTESEGTTCIGEPSPVVLTPRLSFLSLFSHQ